MTPEQKRDKLIETITAHRFYTTRIAGALEVHFTTIRDWIKGNTQPPLGKVDSYSEKLNKFLQGVEK